MAAANAQIGVAIAAYYPTITLSAAGGFEAATTPLWFTWPSRFWSLGAAAAQTIFQGGALVAQTDAARAAYDSTVAAYRQTVLTGFQEVEDNLAAQRILEQEAKGPGRRGKGGEAGGHLEHQPVQGRDHQHPRPPGGGEHGPDQ